MTTRLAYADYLNAFDASAASIVELIDAVDPDAVCPSCPQWTVRDLVAHVGGVHGWCRNIVQGGSARDARPEPEGDLAQWYSGQASALSEVLRAASPEAPAWSFAQDRTAGFWMRRQPHEAEMHRYDLALAAGETAAYDAVLAADGVSEVFDVMIPRMNAKDVVSVRAPIALHADDADVRWLIVPSSQPGEVSYTHEGDPAGAAVQVTGSADRLVTGLWGRTPYDQWTIEGDRGVLDALMTTALTP